MRVDSQAFQISNQSLFKEIRKIEQEKGQQTKTTVPKAAVQHNQAAAKVDKPALDQQNYSMH